MTAPTVTLVNGTGYQWGVAQDEVGINIESFKSSVRPQFIESLGNKQNVNIVKAYGPMVLTVTISGEINAAGTGVMGAVLATAFSPVNAHAYFGAPTTGLYLQAGDVTESRNGWKKLDSAEFMAEGGIP